MSSDAPDPAAYYFLYKMTVYDNLSDGILYGVYLILFVTSTHILLSKPGFTSSLPRMIMFGVTTFMFISGTIMLAIQTALGFQGVQLFLNPTADNVWSLHKHRVIISVGATFERLMYILSDVICAWRAATFWNRDTRVIAILLLFILGTIAGVGYDLGVYIATIFNPSLPGNVKERAGIMIGLILATNLLSTGLIAWKIWQQRSSIRKLLGTGSGNVMAERVFALLIESCFLYCCFWIVVLITAFGVLPETGIASSVVNSTAIFVSGLYPTLVIILVAMQKSPIEHYAAHSNRMRFTSEPLELPRDGSKPQYVYSVRREYASHDDETL